MKNHFTMPHLSEEFERAGENLAKSLSGINLTMWKDVHYDDFEMQASFFGEDGPDSNPVVDEIVSNLDELLDHQDSDQEASIHPELIIGMFDQALLRFIHQISLRPPVGYDKEILSLPAPVGKYFNPAHRFPSTLNQPSLPCQAKNNKAIIRQFGVALLLPYSSFFRVRNHLALRPRPSSSINPNCRSCIKSFRIDRSEGALLRI